ncbi:efflux RND transporter permease subunit, partial [Salinimicrobium sp. CDJ15-91]|nr:efflux RND transporter permease subunit [Salinimicrobium oceani]
LFVIVLLVITLAALLAIVRYYESILNWCLGNKKTFLALPVVTIFFGLLIWLGVPKIFGFVADAAEEIGWDMRESSGWIAASEAFPGVGKEFMPTLNEGSFLLMPTAMPHLGLEGSKEVLQKLDMAVTNIPEVEVSVGKLGRAETAIDPAPISMYENVINYKPEYILNEDGDMQRFKVDEDGNFVLKSGEAMSHEQALL